MRNRIEERAGVLPREGGNKGGGVGMVVIYYYLYFINVYKIILINIIL